MAIKENINMIKGGEAKKRVREFKFVSSETKRGIGSLEIPLRIWIKYDEQ